MLAFGLDAYNASIVAEGIETLSELRTLQGLGCHFGQGYYLGRPAQMSVLPRQLSEPGASPSPGLRSRIPHSGGTVTPELPELEELEEQAETARAR
jgi:predicted signal transduction protein with EAL and GGDEF domain